MGDVGADHLYAYVYARVHARMWVCRHACVRVCTDLTQRPRCALCERPRRRKTLTCHHVSK